MSLIAKSSDCVLAEHTDYNGNFQQISRFILPKIQNDTKGIIKSGIRKFVYFNEDGVTFMCLTEEISNEVSYAFLYDLKKSLFGKYNMEEVETMNAFGLKSMESEMTDLMEYFAIQPSMTKSGSLVDDYKAFDDCSQELLTKFINRDISLQVITKKDDENLNFENNINNIVRKIIFYFIYFLFIF